MNKISVRKLYAAAADTANQPVSTTGKIGRAILCELATYDPAAVLALLKRYRIKRRK